MENLALQYIRKVKDYPREVDMFFESDTFNELLASLSKKYDLEESWLLDTVYELVISGFDFKQLDKKIQSLDFLPVRQKEFTKNFLLSFIAPVSSLLPKEVPLELKVRGLNESEIVEAFQVIINLVEDESLEKLDKVAENYNSAWNAADEENDVIGIFDNELVDVLKNTDQDSTEILNSAIFRLLDKVPLFKDKISKNLYQNNQVLTSRPLALEGRKVPGTVSNWLKDFISQNGSDFFNSVILSKYVASSQNAVSLDPEEKHLLSRLLKLYRNLTFYPGSLANIPIEEWEIIPLERSAEAARVASASPQLAENEEAEPKAESEVPKTGSDKGTAETAVTGQATAVKENVPASGAPAPSADKLAQIRGLSELAEQFPAGSLERKAIDEEIKKLM